MWIRGHLWAKWIWNGRHEGVGLTHAKTSPLADRGGDASTISKRKPAVNRPSRNEAGPIRFAAMSAHRASLQVRPFEPGDLDAAARLLAERHRRHRLAEPLLDPAYEAPAATRPQIEALLGSDKAAGWVAERGGAVVAYLIGVAKPEAMWGPNVWVEAPGQAADDPADIRELYAVAAGAWVA